MQNRLANLLTEKQKGLPVVGEKQRVEDFLKDWLKNWVKSTVKPKTYSSYDDTVRLHLIPALGRVVLSKLAPQQVQMMLGDRQRSGLSPRTVGYIRSVLGIALTRALKVGLVHRDVVPLVDRPNAVRHEIHPFTNEQARALLAAARDHRLGALFSVAVFAATYDDAVRLWTAFRERVKNRNLRPPTAPFFRDYIAEYFDDIAIQVSAVTARDYRYAIDSINIFGCFLRLLPEHLENYDQFAADTQECWTD